jgi:NADP-dependent 3-hydroxy acid dehydrogenase YdfG
MSNCSREFIAIIAGSGDACLNIINGLLKNNATVIVPVKSYHELELLKAAIGPVTTGELVTLLTDLPDYDKAVSFLEDIKACFGKIDLIVVVFNNEGPAGPLTEVPYTEWERMEHDSITACFIAGKVILDSLKRQCYGTYITVTNALSPASGNLSPLSTIAGAMQTELSKQFNIEVRPHGVKYYHVFTDQTRERIDSIAPYIINLYNGNVKYPDNTFHKLTSLN